MVSPDRIRRTHPTGADTGFGEGRKRAASCTCPHRALHVGLYVPAYRLIERVGITFGSSIPLAITECIPGYYRDFWEVNTKHTISTFVWKAVTRNLIGLK